MSKNQGHYPHTTIADIRVLMANLKPTNEDLKLAVNGWSEFENMPQLRRDYLTYLRRLIYEIRNRRSDLRRARHCPKSRFSLKLAEKRARDSRVSLNFSKVRLEPIEMDNGDIQYFVTSKTARKHKLLTTFSLPTGWKSITLGNSFQYGSMDREGVIVSIPQTLWSNESGKVVSFDYLVWEGTKIKKGFAVIRHLQADHAKLVNNVAAGKKILEELVVEEFCQLANI